MLGLSVGLWRWKVCEWIPLHVSMPVEYKTVLVQHKNDLYPVSAFRMGNTWFLETEGPEDIWFEGRLRQLYRNPTHWMPLPPPPEE